VQECDEADASILQETEPKGLHYWYVLDRVAKREDQGHKFAVSLLELYTPRNLYALYNLVLKAEGLFAGTAGYDLLRLALLRCLDLGSKLNTVRASLQPLTPLACIHRRVSWNGASGVCSRTQRASCLSNNPSRPWPWRIVVKAVVAPVSEASAGVQGPDRAFVGHMSVRQLASSLPPASAKLILSRALSLGAHSGGCHTFGPDGFTGTRKQPCCGLWPNDAARTGPGTCG